MDSRVSGSRVERRESPGRVKKISRVPPELAAYLAKPSAELVKLADEVRRDPSLLKPTCCRIAYEVYSYAGRGAEIEETVSAWIRGEYSPE